MPHTRLLRALRGVRNDTLARTRAQTGLAAAAVVPKPRREHARRSRGWVIGSALAFLVTCLTALAYAELQTSTLQAYQVGALVDDLTYAVEAGSSSAIRFPVAGPYDERLGYSRIESFLPRLEEHGFSVATQARFSPAMLRVAEWGLFPPYREKDQAGLLVLDHRSEPLFSFPFPRRTYQRFEDIPPIIVSTLLAIENRELLNADRPNQNPAIEWDRLLRAALEYPLSIAQPGRKGPGGSTLATQLEKVRHSPRGVTGSISEKLRQIASASLRAYAGGKQTLATRRRIVLHYLNALPLAAIANHGEIIGLADGLDAWYGADFDTINGLLMNANTSFGDVAVDPQSAEAYKLVLSLLLAQRRPTYFLRQDPGALVALTDAYLRVLSRLGVVSGALREAALNVPVRPHPSVTRPSLSFVRDAKTSVRVRTDLAALLGVWDVYALDRLDLEAHSTLDRPTQERATALLKGLSDPEVVRATGLRGERLLGDEDPAHVVYSFSLYERANGQNYLRAQVDNLEQPFNAAEDMKLDLGSTAKLRTLTTYLELVAELYRRASELPPNQRLETQYDPGDAIARWVAKYLAAKPTATLSDVLEAAMDRRYSASPRQRFFTGGGLHTFENFDDRDDDKVFSVRVAFRRSVNLVFIRLMREIVRHYMFALPAYREGIASTRAHPLRPAYLARFADREGRQFLSRFYRKHQRLSNTERVDVLLQGVDLTPKRLAVILRSIDPYATPAAFAAAMQTYLPHAGLHKESLMRLFDKHDAGKLTLSDRGYIARVHPLELWLVAYLRENPAATLADAIEASADERLSVYRWLFKTRRKGVQDRRIQTLLEIEAFAEIHQQWQSLGYPFDHLVPSYASAIGSSADKPAALAELVGIVLNEGMRYPTRRIQHLRFAEATPYETSLSTTPSAGVRVMRPEVARVVRDALVDVVERGTAKRASGTLSNRGGEPLIVGGKTGTGDHRRKVYGANGQLLTSHALNRSATFVFFTGERFYGVVCAYVAGSRAAEYRFTSSLAVQLFRTLFPLLGPLFEGPTQQQLVAQSTPPA